MPGQPTTGPQGQTLAQPNPISPPFFFLPPFFPPPFLVFANRSLHPPQENASHGRDPAAASARHPCERRLARLSVPPPPARLLPCRRRGSPPATPPPSPLTTSASRTAPSPPFLCSALAAAEPARARHGRPDLLLPLSPAPAPCSPLPRPPPSGELRGRGLLSPWLLLLPRHVSPLAPRGWSGRAQLQQRCLGASRVSSSPRCAHASVPVPSPEHALFASLRRCASGRRAVPLPYSRVDRYGLDTSPTRGLVLRGFRSTSLPCRGTPKPPSSPSTLKTCCQIGRAHV